MDDDETRRLLQQSVDEGDLGGAGPEEEAIAGRVRAARRRPFVVVAAVAVVALIAVVVWRTGLFDRSTAPPSTSTPTTATGAPTSASPSGEESEGTSSDGGDVTADAVLPDISDVDFGECGEVYAPPSRASALVVETGPSEAMPDRGGGWVTTVSNTGDELVQAQIASIAVVVVDGEGRLVAGPDPDDDLFLGAEGSSWMGLEGGASLDTRIQVPASCDTGDWLAAGDYQVYGAITFVAGDGDDQRYEQAQGGPWPITIGGGPEADLPPVIPDGTAAATLECGATWEAPQPTTGFGVELLDAIRSPRPAGDDIDGRAAISVAAPIDSTVFTEVVVLRDGVIVNQMPGTDNALIATATAGTSYPDGFYTGLLDCDEPMTDPQPLPAGEYQVVVVAMAAGPDGATVLAATDPAPLELT